VIGDTQLMDVVSTNDRNQSIMHRLANVYSLAIALWRSVMHY